MGMEVKGWDEANRGFNKLKSELPDAAGDAVDDSVDVLYDASQIQVPKKTGDLAASAKEIAHSQSGSRRSKGIRYGDGALNSSGESYAAAVHEILKASHAPPTGAKYVEQPLVENIKTYSALAADHSEDAVRRSFK